MDSFQWAQDFSKQLKIAKNDYVFGEYVSIMDFNYFIDAFKEVDLNILDNDLKKKTFFINVYNGLTNYLIIKEKVKTQMKEIPDFFKTPAITFGQHRFSLDDIEHGLLRRNARKHMQLGDKRLQFQVKTIDYRIHFALNCGATSCPSIANYTLANIEEELDLATSVFVENEFTINHQNKTITCSEIFVWYREDFKTKYLNNPKYKDYTIIKKNYSWAL